ncbi:hypothetical protein PPL_05079 [Heterostelium album PN500]|uniref:Ankyrin repeat protein n=1 Tax=Heterostelium pallidum (strain ATCC 26659 / Pp 5 / PN500) TaxID=670386 RepID=D3B9D5_HETP5|nr:hypothetical protein PPL_05079 [Heterostelium album PN500]EFA81847.1 hypothetical protein PPL_05079 [Heterostelium album PN500]|eukprot:XP_020433964.1 hypothetical protein PPL_05079 [Heterostelium album PN500]
MNNIRNYQSYKWNEALDSPHVLAGNGYFDLLKKCINRKSNGIIESFDMRLLNCAIRGGSVEMFSYLFDLQQLERRIEIKSPQYFPNELLANASQCGRLDIVQFLLDRITEYLWDFNYALAQAPFSGDLSVLKFFSDPKYARFYQPRTNYGEVFNSAARSGNIAMIEWLVENRSQGLEKSNMLLAAISGKQLETIEYLLRNHHSLFDKKSPEYLRVVTHEHNSSIETFKLFYDQGFACSDTVFRNATISGNLPLLKWLHSNTTYKCTDSMYLASDYNYFDILKWLNENRSGEGCSYNEMDVAATNGNLEIVRFLHQNRSEGCSYNAFDGAAENGHLHVVQWLYANRTNEGFSVGTIDQVAMKGHHQVVEWLELNTTQRCSRDILEYVVEEGHLGMLIYCHERNGDNNHYRFSEDTMDVAISRGHLHMAKWLHANRTEGCTPAAFLNAIRSDTDRTDIIEWIFENRTEYSLELVDLDDSVQFVLCRNNHRILTWLLERVSYTAENLRDYINIMDSYYPTFIESIDVLNHYLQKCELSKQIKIHEITLD